MRTSFKRYLLIATLTMAVAWMFGVLRFTYPIAEKVFQIVLFPFGWLYLIVENYAMHDGLQDWMDDEFGQGLLFLLFVLLQAWFYYLIVWFVRRLKYYI